MDERYDKLPEPAALSRTAIIKFCCGSDFVEVLCFAASIRTVEWDDTHEQVTWLHCIAAQTDRPKDQKQGTTMQLLIPVQYITGFLAGPKTRGAHNNANPDVNIFPPEYPAPANQLPLATIESLVASLRPPQRKKKASAASAKVS